MHRRQGVVGHSEARAVQLRVIADIPRNVAINEADESNHDIESDPENRMLLFEFLVRFAL